jgi:hypothetical protein
MNEGRVDFLGLDQLLGGREILDDVSIGASIDE